MWVSDESLLVCSTDRLLLCLAATEVQAVSDEEVGNLHLIVGLWSRPSLFNLYPERLDAGIWRV